MKRYFELISTRSNRRSTFFKGRETGDSFGQSGGRIYKRNIQLIVYHDRGGWTFTSIGFVGQR